jgi:hypothetical protein
VLPAPQNTLCPGIAVAVGAGMRVGLGVNVGSLLTIGRYTGGGDTSTSGDTIARRHKHHTVSATHDTTASITHGFIL